MKNNTERPSNLTDLRRRVSATTAFWALVSVRNPKEMDSSRIVVSILQKSLGPFGDEFELLGNRCLSIGVIRPTIPPNCSRLCIAGQRGPEDPPDWCLIEGDLVGISTSTDPTEGDPAARHVLRKLSRSEDLSEIKGAYSGIFVQPRNGSVTVFCDPAGVRPIYWYANAHLILVTSNLWAVRGLPESLEVDRLSLLQRLILGHPLAEQTWFKGVKRLEWGHWLQFSTRSHNVSTIRVGNSPQREAMKFRTALGRVREAVDAGIKEISSSNPNPIGLALSGGLDSRIVLAGLRSLGIDFRASTFGYNESAPDVVTARQCATLVGATTTAILSNAKLAHALVYDSLAMTEGNSEGVAYLLTGQSLSRSTNSSIFGTWGDVLSGVPLGPLNPLRFSSEEALQGCLLGLFHGKPLWRWAGRILQSHRSEEELESSWYESFRSIRGPLPVDVYLDHAEANRFLRMTRPILDTCRLFCVPYHFFVMSEVRSAYRSIPAQFLDGQRLHLELLRSYGLRLERVPSSNRLSLPLGLGKIPAGWEYNLRHFIRAGRKLKSWANKPGGPGPRPLANEEELRDLLSCPIFDKGAVSQFLRDAYIDRKSVRSLLSVAHLYNLAFQSGADRLNLLPADRPLHASRRLGSQSRFSADAGHWIGK